VGKSATTRARLQREALRLFADRGYDETTIADIAAAAGVTQMTFFRYFPAKELVVVDDPYDPAIAHSVAAQATDLPVVERVRRGLLAAWEQLEEARLRGLPRVFRTVEFVLFHAAACSFKYSMRTWCGVR
jgi:AcrR family transcriptional regulator